MSSGARRRVNNDSESAAAASRGLDELLWPASPTTSGSDPRRPLAAAKLLFSRFRSSSQRANKP